MFETFLFNSEKKHSLFSIFLASVLITIIFGIINFFIGGNSIFLVAFVSLALSYPTISYIKNATQKEMNKLNFQKSSQTFMKKYEKKLSTFWSIFIGVIIGFFIISPLIDDYSYHQTFVEGISGNIIKTESKFYSILTNNLTVLFFTFILSLISFSSLILILVWNASIVAYYLYSLSSFKIAFINGILLMAHGLLEIGGYILIGISGFLISYRLNLHKTFNYKFDTKFIFEILFLIILSLIFIILGAIIEIS